MRAYDDFSHVRMVLKSSAP